MHLRTYGHATADQEVEVVNVRLSAFGALPTEPTGTSQAPHRALADPGRPAGQARDAARVAVVSALLPGESAAGRFPVFQRDLIEPGKAVTGPAIVHQLDSTTVVLPGQRARVDALRSMWLEEIR